MAAQKVEEEEEEEEQEEEEEEEEGSGSDEDSDESEVEMTLDEDGRIPGGTPEAPVGESSHRDVRRCREGDLHIHDCATHSPSLTHSLSLAPSLSKITSTVARSAQFFFA
jgi:hypothetical protein